MKSALIPKNAVPYELPKASRFTLCRIKVRYWLAAAMLLNIAYATYRISYNELVDQSSIDRQIESFLNPDHAALAAMVNQSWIEGVMLSVAEFELNLSKDV
jgi:hypothetical protein